MVEEKIEPTTEVPTFCPCEIIEDRLVCKCPTEEAGDKMEAILAKGVVIQVNVTRADPHPELD